MKKLGYILICFLLVGCANKATEYKEVSDAVISVLKTNEYSKKGLNNSQISLIEEYIENRFNKEINVSNFIIDLDTYKTNQPNTEGVYFKNNQCFIKYNDLNFITTDDRNGEEQAEVICNGYIITVPGEYANSVENIDQEYRFLGYYEDGYYHFAYRSYTDGSGLIVTVSDEITTEFTSVDNLDLKSVSESKNGNKIIVVVSAVIVGGCALFIVKKSKENNDI